jgi:glutamine synthetase
MSENAARVNAIQQIVNRQPIPPKAPSRLEDIWAENVFNLSKMQASLPKTVFKSIKNTIVTG